MGNKFKINGYWKDDVDDEFYDLIVSSEEHGEDEDVFYYGLDEQKILNAIELGDKSEFDFIITSYFEF